MTKHVTILLIHYLFIIAYRLSFLLFVTNEVFREKATKLEEKLGMNSDYFACLVSLVQRIWRNTGNQAKFAFGVLGWINFKSRFGTERGGGTGISRVSLSNPDYLVFSAQNAEELSGSYTRIFYKKSRIVAERFF